MEPSFRGSLRRQWDRSSLVSLNLWSSVALGQGGNPLRPRAPSPCVSLGATWSGSREPEQVPGAGPRITQGWATTIVPRMEVRIDRYIGIDVSKATLDVASLPDGES